MLELDILRAKQAAYMRGWRKRTHAISASSTYESWKAMRVRCFRKTFINYKNYGGRGITVCDRWMKFENFVADMGLRPEGKTLDRIDNDGNYGPGNCKWSTPAEQIQNRRPKSHRTHCLRGHLFTKENSYISPATGNKACRICRNAREKRNRQKRDLSTR